VNGFIFSATETHSFAACATHNNNLHHYTVNYTQQASLLNA